MRAASYVIYNTAIGIPSDDTYLRDELKAVNIEPGLWTKKLEKSSQQ
jgi:hypothetical protein